MDASGRAVRRALMVGAAVVCGVVWAVVVVSAALLASGARVTATLGSLVWSGPLPGIIAALALALPGMAGVAAGALRAIGARGSCRVCLRFLPARLRCWLWLHVAYFPNAP